MAKNRNITGTNLIKAKSSWFSAAIRFIILFVIWLILSGQFDFFHIAVGVLCCLLVEALVGRTLAFGFSPQMFSTTLRFFFMYLPWLLGQIVISNFQVLYITLNPKMYDLIDPQVIKFRTKIKSEIGRYIFANSITLTPGTTTVYVSMHGDFSVHVLNKNFADALPGKMEEMVMKTLGEK